MSGNLNFRHEFVGVIRGSSARSNAVITTDNPYIQSIDEWVRKRIRMVFWKKWKRVRTRWRNLLKLGISNTNAGILANSRKGYWRVANSPILKTALANQRLEKAGFQFFNSYYRKSVAA